MPPAIPRRKASSARHRASRLARQRPSARNPLRTATLDQAIAARLEVYRHALPGGTPAVYVNVGGNHASLGGAQAPLRHDGGG